MLQLPSGKAMCICPGYFPLLGSLFICSEMCAFHNTTFSTLTANKLGPEVNALDVLQMLQIKRDPISVEGSPSQRLSSFAEGNFI